MPREENVKILEMLREGKITADEAAQLLAAIEASEKKASPESPAAPEPPTAPEPPSAPEPPATPRVPVPPSEADVFDSEALARARAKISAAREKITGVSEKLAAAEEKIEAAEGSADPMKSLGDALKDLRDLPGVRSLAQTFRGIDPAKLASEAKKTAQKLGRTVSDSLEGINIDLGGLGDALKGEPTLSHPYEAIASVGAGETVRIKNILGDIAVEGADISEVRVAGTLKIWATDEAAAQAVAELITLTTETTEGGATIAVEVAQKVRNANLNLKVFVPKDGISVSLFSPSGDLSARSLAANLVLATQSGDLQIGHITGNVAAESASGEILIEGVTGNITAHSASGDVRALRITGQTFKAESQSGDIQLSDATLTTLVCSTASGDVQVLGTTTETLTARSVSGDVSAKELILSNDLTLDTVSGNLSLALSGSVLTGKLVLSSVSGDVRVKLPVDSNVVLEARTRTGDLSGRVRDDAGSVKNIGGSGQVIVSETIGLGTGAALVLSSVSGDLKVEQE